MNLRVGIVGLIGVAGAYGTGRLLVPAARPPAEVTVAAGQEEARGDGEASIGGAGYRQQFAPEMEAPSDLSEHDRLFALAGAWASESPAEAVAWMHGLQFDDVRNPYLFAALTQWAEHDPDGASTWLTGNYPEGDARRAYLDVAIVRGLARNDPGRAADWLLAMPGGPERDGALEFVTDAWLMDGGEAAFGRLERLPSDEIGLRKRAVRYLMTDLESSEIPPARDWALGGAPAGLRTDAQVALAARWSQDAPGDAATWALTLPDPRARKAALAEVTTRWARYDPRAAGAWLDSSGGANTFDLARRAYAGNTVAFDPERAFSELAKISDPALRDESLEQVARMWIGEQPARARQFLAGSSHLVPTMKNRLLEGFE